MEEAITNRIHVLRNKQEQSIIYLPASTILDLDVVFYCGNSSFTFLPLTTFAKPTSMVSISKHNHLPKKYLP